MTRAFRSVTRRAVCALGAAASVSGAAQALAAQDTPKSPVRARTTYEDMQMFGQVLNQIRVNHPDSVDTHELLMAAIQGMVRAADPHSYVIPAMRLDPGKEEQLRSGKLYPVPISFLFIGGEKDFALRVGENHSSLVATFRHNIAIRSRSPLP